MESVKELIKNIVICYVIINIIDALLISRKYEKYIKVFTGIIIMLIIINTGEKICGQVILGEKNNLMEREIIERYSKEASECAKNTERGIDKARKLMTKEYEENVVTYLKDEYEIDVTNIDINEDRKKQVKSIVIKIKDNIGNSRLSEVKKDEIEGLVKEKICEYYNVRKECIKVRFV